MLKKRKIMKKRFYVIHKWLGIVACAAVFAWSVTGFLHPLMSWTQPRPAQPFLKRGVLTPEQFKVPLSAALAQNNIKTLGGFNVVSFNGAAYYQILPANQTAQTMSDAGADCHSSVVSQTINEETPLYLSVADGGLLPEGDQRYAEYLARHFADEKNAPVKSQRLVTDFDESYRAVNRLLPVYEVAFDRADGLKAFVDTGASQLGTLVDTRKARLQWAFTSFHNLELAGMPNRTRQVFITLLMSAVFLTALSGLIVYGLFWRVWGKQKAETSRSVVRKYHRSIGVVVSVFLLAWSGSGMFHLWAKPNLSETAKVSYASSFQAEKLAFEPARVFSLEPAAVGVSLVGFANRSYYRVLKKDQSVAYYNAATGEKLENGESQYAGFLAEKFSGRKNPVSMTPVTKFGGEYGFLLKRLPVMKAQYADNGNERFYVDPSSGKLALKINDGVAQIEDFTFDYFHKGHWLDWAGKYVRDVFLMLMAAGNATVAGLGLWLFAGLRRKQPELV
jgi:hypothetical protein